MGFLHRAASSTPCRSRLSSHWLLAVLANALFCGAAGAAAGSATAKDAALLNAAGACNASAALGHIKAGARLNATDSKGVTLLMLAAMCPSPRFGLLLIKAGAEVNAQHKDGFTALMLAALYNRHGPELARALLKAGAEVNVQDKDGYTALMLAALNRHGPELARALLKAGAEVNVQSKAGATALMHAARYSHGPELARALLKAGAEVNVQQKDGYTALMIAARYRHGPELARALLKAGAEVNVQSKDGDTALMLAAQYRHGPELARALLKAGAEVNVQDKDGCTALMIAARYNRHGPELARALLKAGAEVNVQDKDGYTALMIAARYHRHGPELARALLKAGAEVNVQNKYGYTALMLAARYHRHGLELARVLLKAGAEVNVQEIGGSTALTLAALNEHCPEELALALLKAGAEINACDVPGKTALFYAADSGCTEVAALLLEQGADLLIRSGAGELTHEVARANRHEHLADRLRKATPSGFHLAWWVARRPLTWASVGGGALLGLALGVLARWLSGQPGAVIGPADEECTSLSPPPLTSLPLGAVLLARKALAARDGKRRVYFKLAYRASEAVAFIVFPLGVVMLVVVPWAFLPLYVLLFMVPGLIQHRLTGAACRYTLFSVGAMPRGRFTGMCDPRILRLLGMLALLALHNASPWECGDDISYRLIGNVNQKPPGMLAGMLVRSGSWSLLNPAAATFACPEMNRTRVHDAFDLYLRSVWWLTAAHVVWASLDGLGALGVSSEVAKEQDLVDLARAIAASSTVEELEMVGKSFSGICIEPVVAFKCFPPGGLWVTLAVACLDAFVLDIFTILNLLAAYHNKFALALTAVFTASAYLEGCTLRNVDVRAECSESVRRGFFMDPVVEYLSREKGLEGPMSLAITVYAFPFALRGPLQLFQALLSVALGLYGVAQHAIEEVDMQATAEEGLGLADAAVSQAPPPEAAGAAA